YPAVSRDQGARTKQHDAANDVVIQRRADTRGMTDHDVLLNLPRVLRRFEQDSLERAESRGNAVDRALFSAAMSCGALLDAPVNVLPNLVQPWFDLGIDLNQRAVPRHMDNILNGETDAIKRYRLHSNRPSRDRKEAVAQYR